MCFFLKFIISVGVAIVITRPQEPKIVATPMGQTERQTRKITEGDLRFLG
jgi:hypothetical protein